MSVLVLPREKSPMKLKTAWLWGIIKFESSVTYSNRQEILNLITLGCKFLSDWDVGQSHMGIVKPQAKQIPGYVHDGYAFWLLPNAMALPLCKMAWKC